VGKTTLALQIAEQRQDAVYLDLERPADRLRLEDADAYLRAQAGRLVIIDEIHRAPALFEPLLALPWPRGASDRELSLSPRRKRGQAAP
jgi:predicted AAA+ superfamily ATPase